MKKHVIIPSGGIGNRIRVILSALQWQNDTGNKIKLLWVQDAGLACPFEKLFQPIPEINERKGLFWYKVFRKIYLHIPIRYMYVFDYNEYNQLRKWIANPKGILYSSSYSIFYKGDSPKYHDVFKLNNDLQVQLNDIIRTFDTKIIGIHIRRTDNLESIKGSPIQKFVDYINASIVSEHDLKYYLATDDIEVKRYFIKMFGDRIITKDYKLRRDTEEGVIGALLELYTLASCSKIIGSYYSSYSELAAEIGGIPLEIL